MLADDLLGAVALDPLRSGVPARHVSLRIQHDDGGVGDAFHHQPEAFLGPSQFLFHQLARGVIGPDQQVADDCASIVAQRRDRHDCRKAAAVLADVGQLVDVLDPARGLEHQRLEARRNRGG